MWDFNMFGAPSSLHRRWTSSSLRTNLGRACALIMEFAPSPVLTPFGHVSGGFTSLRRDNRYIISAAVMRLLTCYMLYAITSFPAIRSPACYSYIITYAILHVKRFLACVTLTNTPCVPCTFTHIRVICVIALHNLSYHERRLLVKHECVCVVRWMYHLTTDMRTSIRTTQLTALTL